MRKLIKLRRLLIVGICILICYLSSSNSGMTTVKGAEADIGQTSTGSWNNGSFYEKLTYELISYNDATDQGTYRIRYYIVHWGTSDSYTYQVSPAILHVDGSYQATFGDHVDEHISNETKFMGSTDVTVSAGQTHLFSLSDEGGGITNINLSVSVTLPYRTFTVKYVDHDGTELKKSDVQKYSDASAPSDPSRTGYTFSGWSSDGKNITSDITITAQYTINYYTVRYLDYNDTVLKNESVAYSSNATPPNNPTRTGYTFTGWSNNGANITADRDIKAQYKINSYPISFNSMGGSNVSPQTVQYQSKVSKPSDPTRTGYKFMGWYTNTNYTTAYNFGSNIGASGFTLYAKWDKFPTLTIPSGFTVIENQYTTSAWNNLRKTGATATDVEDGTITNKIKITDTVELFMPGTYKVVYTVTDSVGNTVSKQAPVTVKYNNPPVITAKNQSFYEGQYTKDQWLKQLQKKDVTAYDIEDGTITNKVKVIEDTVQPDKTGTYKVVYEVTDKYQKKSTKAISVTVKYNNPPVITAPTRTFYESELSKKEWEKLRLQNVVARDQEDGTISKIEIVRDDVILNQLGIYDVVYRATDQWGKSSEKTVKITVKYNNPPLITAKNRAFYENEITEKQWQEKRLQEISANDREDGIITSKIEIIEDNVDVKTPSIYYVKYKVTDSLGKVNEKQISVNIKYNNFPIIKKDHISIHEGEYNTDTIEKLLMKDITATDAEDGNITSKIRIIANDVNPSKAGNYEVTYEVTDAYGKTTTKTIDVNVIENQQPTLQIFAPSKRFTEGEITEAQWQEKRMVDVTAHDREDNDLTDKLSVIEDTTNVNKAGDYQVTYKVTDKWNKSTTKTAKVTVEPNNAPVIFASDKWFKTTDKIDSISILKDVFAFDDHDGDISKQVQIKNSNVKSGVAGDYHVTYSVQDGFGKTTEKQVTVYIKDYGSTPIPPIPPVITDPSALQLFNGRDLGYINITKLLEDSIFNHADAYKDVVFGVFAAEDITYKGEVILSKDSMIAIANIDETGQISATIYHAGNYYLKEIDTDHHFNLDTNKYYFSFNYE